VLAKTTMGSITTQQLDVYLKEADPDSGKDSKDKDKSKTSASAQKPAQKKGPTLPGSDSPSQIDHMIATGRVVVTEPNRRAVGDRLVYTADDAKYVLTGKLSSIFDAEHGTVWGDSLTFFSHDDRVLVESKRSDPTITRARTTK
jgi:lipopolysaccharide export system protein LptA